MVDMIIMSLHRAIRSDWSEVPPQKRNIWQRWAAASHGVLTPGNLISIIGAALVIFGLYLLTQDYLISGFATVIVGRLADILDGLLAELTKTKSPLGEGVDASIDKILIVVSLFVLLDRQLIPLLIGIVMAIHAIYMIVLSSISRRVKTFLHPSRSGKLCAVFEWLSVGLFLLYDIFKQQNISTTIVFMFALISFGLFVYSAIWSTLNYTRKVYYKQTMSP